MIGYYNGGEDERDASPSSGDITRQFDIVASWFNYAVGRVSRRCAVNIDGWSRQGYFWHGGERRCVYIKGTKHPRGFSRYAHAVAAAWLKSLVGGQQIARWRGPIIIRHAGIRLLNDAETISRYVLLVLNPPSVFRLSYVQPTPIKV